MTKYIIIYLFESEKNINYNTLWLTSIISYMKTMKYFTENNYDSFHFKI